MNKTWIMNTRAVKCSRCKDGYRHPVGNCVLCDAGPSRASNFGWPDPSGKGLTKKPKTDEEKFMALGELNMQLSTTDPINPKPFFGIEHFKDIKWELYISWNYKV